MIAIDPDATNAAELEPSISVSPIVKDLASNTRSIEPSLIVITLDFTAIGAPFASSISPASVSIVVPLGNTMSGCVDASSRADSTPLLGSKVRHRVPLGSQPNAQTSTGHALHP